MSPKTKSPKDSNSYTSSISFYATIGLVIRLILIIYANYHDSHSAIKYTDIDYAVFSDAASYVARGESPFNRSTYRYTPMLAFLMIPNVYLPFFGKILFSVLDILIGYMLIDMMPQNIPEKTKIRYVAFGWLLNPISINISSRGNAESMICFLVVATCSFLLKKKYDVAAIFYGFAVHFKIYPILYGLAILLYMGDQFPPPSQGRKIKRIFSWILNPVRIRFFFISAGTFFLLLALFYQMYGYEFLWETYLYHLVRQDHRHNFSIYFYQIYLSMCPPTSLPSGQHIHIPGLGIITFLPQLILFIYFSIKFGRDKFFFSIFSITMVFVTYNKVMTVQYFVWWMVFLPIILPKISLSLSELAKPFGMWLAALGFWLFWAYKLEMVGLNTYTPIWIASLCFFLTQINLLVTFIENFGVSKESAEQYSIPAAYADAISSIMQNYHGKGYKPKFLTEEQAHSSFQKVSK